MDLRFTDKKTPFLTLEGASQVETVEVAADWQRKDLTPSYVGRNALCRIVDLRRVDRDFNLRSYTDKGIVPKLEAIFTEKGRQSTALHSLGSMAYHESYNHQDEPESQRLGLIGAEAELAIRALQHLANSNPDEIKEFWHSTRGIDHVAVANGLTSQIEQAYDNPLPLDE